MKEWVFDKWYKKVFLVLATIGGINMLIAPIALLLWLIFRSEEKNLKTKWWIANKIWKKFWIVSGAILIIIIFLTILLAAVVIQQWGSNLSRQIEQDSVNIIINEFNNSFNLYDSTITEQGI